MKVANEAIKGNLSRGPLSFEKPFDVIVVGGGAAGLLCAGTAAARGRRVLVCEKMRRPARKVLITGKGRCNVTNDCTAEEFLAAVQSNPRFLYSAYYGFTAQNTMELFESLGVPLVVERGNRVFPESQRSMDIADALVRYAVSNGAVLVQQPVEGILWKDSTIEDTLPTIGGVVTATGEKILGDSVVIATGGKSYPRTGSTGDGYTLARMAGHSIQPLRPSLVSILTQEDWPETAAGLSLRNVTLALFRRGKLVYQEIGELLFTHTGVSGPLVLSASAHMSGPVEDYALAIDLKPGLCHEQLDQRLLRDFEDQSNRDFSNALGKLLPRGLIAVIIEQSGIMPDTKVHQITREQRKVLGDLIKHLPLTPSALGSMEEAVVTAGGVTVDEVNPTTMESKLANGLYFAGEVLDLDAYTGGFNLQIAYSTGFAAGSYC